MRAALAQQRAHAEALAQLGHRRGQVEQALAAGTHVIHPRRRVGQARLRRRDHHDVRRGLVEQRRVRRERQAPGDDARKRLLAEPALRASLPGRRGGDDPPVALDAHGPRARHHRVDAAAQRMEQLTVGVVADRARAPADARPPVDRAGHVEDHVRPPDAPAAACARLQVQSLGDLRGAGGLPRRQQPLEQRRRLLCHRRAGRAVRQAHRCNIAAAPGRRAVVAPAKPAGAPRANRSSNLNISTTRRRNDLLRSSGLAGT